MSHGSIATDGQEHGTTTPAASRPSTDSAATGGEKAALRLLASSVKPLHLPPKAYHCQQCAKCKQEEEKGTWGGGTWLKCKTVCKKCPDTVVVGAEKRLSIQVDGSTAVEYVRSEARGQGRALQSTETVANVDIIQSGTTIFKGTNVLSFENIKWDTSSSGAW